MCVVTRFFDNFVFYNNFTTSYDESEQECRDTYNPSVYARAKKFFEDGSYISITIDDESFDAMGRIVDPTNYLSDNLPPDDIPAIFVAVLNEIPLIPKDDEFYSELPWLSTCSLVEHYNYAMATSRVCPCCGETKTLKSFENYHEIMTGLIDEKVSIYDVCNKCADAEINDVKAQCVTKHIVEILEEETNDNTDK